MQLPLKKNEIKRINPRVLVIYSKPKTGKTTALSMLDNNLIMDLEEGTDFVESLSVKITSLDDIKHYGKLIAEAGYPYEYITIDTVTVLEDLVKPLALKLYQSTPMGKNYKDNDVLKLANGAGYQYLREAFFIIIDYIKTLAPNIILSGHIKDKVIDDQGVLVQAANIDLTGKIKSLICASADAIGFMYRNKDKTILSFKTTDDVTCGARAEHLSNKEIVLLEKQEDGTLKHNWDSIYI